MLVQNSNIVIKNVQKTQKVIYSLENKTYIYFIFLSYVFNENSKKLAVALFFAI